MVLNCFFCVLIFYGGAYGYIQKTFQVFTRNSKCRGLRQSLQGHDQNQRQKRDNKRLEIAGKSEN